MARKANATQTTGAVSAPQTDTAERAAELLAALDAGKLALRTTEETTGAKRDELDAMITKAWYPVCDTLLALKPGLFAKASGCATFKDFLTETMPSWKYATVSSYVNAFADVTVRSHWDALGMGAVVAAQRIMAKKTYSKSEKDQAIKLMTACAADSKNRAKLLNYEKQLRAKYRPAPASPTEKATTLKTVAACDKELTNITARIKELRDLEATVKARKSELRKSGVTVASGKSTPIADPSIPIRRQLAQAVKDGAMTQAAADVFLRNLGYMPRPARPAKDSGE